MFILRTSAENQTAAHHNLIGRSMTAPTACVMAQQHSDATFQPLHYHFHRGCFSASFRIFFIIATFNFFKLPNLKVPKSGTVFIRLFVVFFQFNN
jgi:hypothetical protein